MLAPTSELVRQGLRLVDSGQYAQAIACFESALAHDANDIAALYALGHTAQRLDLIRPAEEFYRKVLALSPDAVEAQVALVNLMRSQGRLLDAHQQLEQFLTADPERPELWMCLGTIFREQNDSEHAETFYRKALSLRPDYPHALGNLADLTADRGDYSTALHLYDRVLELAPNFAQARLNRAMLHFLRGDLAAGWRDYEARLSIPGKVPRPEALLPSWDGQWRAGLRLCVLGEQGIGDQIMFASLLPELADQATVAKAQIFLECEPRLAPLFARSFSTWSVHGWALRRVGGETICEGTWRSANGCDAYVTMGGLATMMRPSLAAFPKRPPPMRVDDAELAHWQCQMADLPRPHIGLCWRSGKSQGIRAVQYAPLAQWGEFLRTLPGSLVLAQYEATAEEVAQLTEISGRSLFVPPLIDQKTEIDRCAALYAALDVMVSAPTATSWLAAAVGTETLKILRDPAWTCFGEACEPFAPCARAFTPKQCGDWRATFAAAHSHLSRSF